MKTSIPILIFICLTSLSTAQTIPDENLPEITLERGQSLAAGEYTNISISGVTLKQIKESNASLSILEALFNEDFEVHDGMEMWNYISFTNSQLKIDFEHMGGNTFQLNAVIVKSNQTVRISGIDFKIGDSISKLSQFKISPQGFMSFYESKDDPIILSDYENYFQVIIDPLTKKIIKIQFMCY